MSCHFVALSSCCRQSAVVPLWLLCAVSLSSEEEVLSHMHTFMCFCSSYITFSSFSLESKNKHVKMNYYSPCSGNSHNSKKSDHLHSDSVKSKAPICENEKQIQSFTDMEVNRIRL